MLTIEKVSKYYGDRKALNHVSLTIPKGSCYGLVGPNGAGKSTLIKIISSIIQDYEGNVLSNHTVFDRSIKRKIGYIPQEICIEQSISAFQNLCFFGKLYGLKGKRLQQRAEQILSYIGLSKRGKDRVYTFSGGMKRRLNIGCALMHEPTIIIMDEPTVGIDPQSRSYIFDMIEQLKQAGCTIIYASHYMEEVERLCDEVAFIDQGKIVESGEIGALLQEYAVPSVFIKGINGLPADMGQFGTMDERNNGYLLTTTEPLVALEKILTYCRKNNSPLERLELVQPRLEDVFFSLTGSQLRDS